MTLTPVTSELFNLPNLSQLGLTMGLLSSCIAKTGKEQQWVPLSLPQWQMYMWSFLKTYPGVSTSKIPVVEVVR